MPQYYKKLFIYTIIAQTFFEKIGQLSEFDAKLQLCAYNSISILYVSLAELLRYD